MHLLEKTKAIHIFAVQNISFVLKFQSMNSGNFKLYEEIQRLFIFAFVLLFFPVKSLASPVPAVGTSALANPQKSYLFHLKGFTLNPTASNWKLTMNDSGSEISASFENHKTSQSGIFSVKTESLANATNVEQYSKRWLRDYSFFGFDVLGAKPFTQNNVHGYVVDLFHKKKNKQVRQILFLKDKTSVILTCTDELSKFKDTLNSCNSVIKTFTWL
jgi:hypothetical protein